MKTVFKFLTLGLILVAFGAISVTSTLAQATLEDCNAIYNDKFLTKRKGPDIASFEAAVAAGKEYLEKCKDLEGQEEVKAYINKQLPIIQEKIKVEKWNRDVLLPFDAAMKAKDADKSFEFGKRILAEQPDYIDVIIALASIGFDTAAANNDKFNSDAINMAKLALQKMNEGKTSTPADKFPNGAWGMYSWVYTTPKCPDGKVNATGWMNYTIGYITFYRLKNQKDAAPYLYKATQVGCETKSTGDIYRMIGSWYIEEFKGLEDKKAAKYKELQDLELAVKKAIDAKDPKQPELEKQFADTEKQYNDILALQKGYMERIIDSYARASKLTTDAKLKDTWLSRAKDFFKFRFNNDLTKFDSWVAETSAKPFPDPTSAVTPVIEATPTTTTTPGSMAVTNDTTTAPTADTRPRTADTTKAATTAAATTTKPVATSKAPAKKPAPKKKGTR